MADDWEKSLLGAVNDIKQYEVASRPPPVVPKKYEWKANIKAVVTLANSHDVPARRYCFRVPSLCLCT
jgi:hypothetical protein